MARAFNGGQSLSAPYDARLEPVAPIAISLWCKASASPGNFKYLLSKVCNSSDHASYAIATEGTGGLRFSIAYGTNAGQFTNSPAIPSASIWNGLWHHVIGYFDGAALFMFFDGAQQGTFSSTPNGNIAYQAYPVNLGSFDTASLYFTGELAEVAIWNMVPTTADIAALVAGYSPATVRSDKIIAYWPLLGYGLPEIEPINGLGMSLAHGVTPSITAHPRTFRRTRSLFIPPPSAAAPPPSTDGASNSVTLTDAVTRAVSLQRDTTGQVTVADGAAYTFAAISGASDQVAVVEEPARTFAASRATSEQVSMFDAATVSAEILRTLADVISLGDSSSSVRSVSKNVAEAVTFSDVARIGFTPSAPPKAAAHSITATTDPAWITRTI